VSVAKLPGETPGSESTIAFVANQTEVPANCEKIRIINKACLDLIISIIKNSAGN
jgi:hypothetical protein